MSRASEMQQSERKLAVWYHVDVQPPILETEWIFNACNNTHPLPKRSENLSIMDKLAHSYDSLMKEKHPTCNAYATWVLFKTKFRPRQEIETNWIFVSGLSLMRLWYIHHQEIQPYQCTHTFLPSPSLQTPRYLACPSGSL